MAFILFLIIFFCLQSFVLFCCVACRKRPGISTDLRSGADGLYQNLDGKPRNVTGIEKTNRRETISQSPSAVSYIIYNESETCSDHLRLAACVFQSLYNLIFMIGSKGLHGYFQLYGRITVGGNKLIMVKLNDISLILSYDACHTYQLSCFIRNQYRNCKNTVSLDQSVLNYRGHGNYIHISSA